MNSPTEKVPSKMDFNGSEKEIATPISLPDRNSGNKCPDCNERLYRSGGCPICFYCGWSRCP